MEHLIKESVQFKECTKVALHNVKSEEFDIIEDQSLTNDGYCQALIDKVFEISHSEISDFIKHHLIYVKDKLHWINKFEKLLSVNEFLFTKGRNKTKLIKLYTSIETIRISLVKTHFFTNEGKPSPRHINAESDERYFSFSHTDNKIKKMDDYCEQILFLTQEKHEYEQADLEFINLKLENFAIQCQKKIDHLQHIRKLKEELMISELKAAQNNSINKKL